MKSQRKFKGQLNLYEQSKTQMEDTSEQISRRIATEQVFQQEVKYNNLVSENQENNQSSQILQKTHNNENLSARLHDQIYNNISQQIQLGKLSISLNKTDFNAQSKRKKSSKKEISQQSLKQKLNQMQRKKNQTIQILKQLEDEEKQIKRKSVSIIRKKQTQKKGSLKKERSFFSPEQKTHVKQILKKNAQLEDQLKKKTLQALQIYLKATQQQKQKHSQQLQKIRSVNRSFIQQNKKSLQKKKLDRLREIQNGNKNLFSLKSKKYLYQSKQQIQQKKALQESFEIKKKLEVIKSNMKVSTAQQIKEHQDRYKEIIKSKIQQRNSYKMTNFSGTEESYNEIKSLRKKIEQNYFTKLVKQQIEVKREIQQQAKSRPFKLKQKVKHFSQQFDLQIRPKIRINEQSRFVPAQRNSSVNSLNYIQQRNKGNQYLSVARKLKKCQTIENERSQRKLFSEDHQSGSLKISYKNYLNEMRRLSENNPEGAKKKFQQYLQKQGTISQFNSLHKAVVTAQSYEAKSKKCTNQKMIDSVQNKINILKMII